MSGVSMPVTRPAGRALIVGSVACRSGPLVTLQQMGFQCTEAEDPYVAMVELCRRPLAYRAMILTLGSLYREELQMVATVKQRFAHIEIWLAQTDGRAGAMAEALRFGADGLLSDDGLHRLASSTPVSQTNNISLPAQPEAIAPPQLAPPFAQPAAGEHAFGEEDSASGEPVLSADELRALLSDHPPRPTAGMRD